MNYPQFLQPGGTIGFVAPSFGCATEPYKTAFDHALSKWQHQGYHTHLGPNCYKDEGVGISSSPESCGKELTDSYCSRESDVLISCGGGELMCEILPCVDFERIKKVPPKWYMGYSDNTNMTYLLTTLCDTASIYGPCAAAFGMEPPHPVIMDAFDILTGKKLSLHSFDAYETESLKSEENPLAPYNCTEKSTMRFFVPDEQGHFRDTDAVKMKGRLLGGCLDCLTNLSGTEYDGTAAFCEKYRGDGILWFIEACDLNVFSIRRALWQLKHTGWFQYVSGFLIGRPLNGAPMMNLTKEEAVLDVLSEYQKPIILDADLGHLPPSMPLICGSIATIHGEGNKITIDMKLQ